VALRRVLSLIVFLVLTTPSLAQEAGGISSPPLSRCAGKIGLDARQSDAAFGIIMLNGAPWLSIERTEEKVGSQPIASTVTGTGSQRRRNRTMAPFRFTCLLDDKGEVVMLQGRRGR
jgi:hypothetical protein